MELYLNPIKLSTIARKFGCSLVGPDKEIMKFGNLSTNTNVPEKQLTYATGYNNLIAFNQSQNGASIIHESLFEYCKPDKSYLITKGNAEQLFYDIFFSSYTDKKFRNLETSLGQNNVISASAVIHESVVIGNDCIISDNVVILPNTIIGDRVVIKPNSVIGGDGFQVKHVNGIRRVIPHVGGVIIKNDVEIGSCVTIDKGLFGEFTCINEEVKIDSQVHISHSTSIGKKTSLAAGSVVAGGVVIGENVWIGIGSTINQLLSIGDYSFVGAQAAVVKSIRSHEKVYGVPARNRGWICICRSEIKNYPTQNLLSCTKCDFTVDINDI